LSTTPPQRFYGWRITWALAVTQTVGYGVIYYTFSVFLQPMELEMGWTRAQASGAFSMALLLSGLIALPVGRWVDARGGRLVMTVGSVAGVALLLAWSYVTTLPALYLVQAALGVVMGMVLYDVAFTVLASWFRRNRIRAMIIVTLVAGLASTIFIPLATVLLEEFGWRVALRLLALLLAVTTVPLHAIVLRDRPARLGLEADGASAEQVQLAPEVNLETRQALRTGAFWWLSLSSSLDRIAIVGIAAHTVVMLLERGHSPGLVASVAGAIGLMQVGGRLLFSPASGRASLVQLAVLTYVIRVVSLVVLLLVPGQLGLWTFAALFGVANGASTLARAGLIGAVFGAAHYGSISGSMTLLIAVAQTVSPIAIGLVRDRSGSYDAALLILAGLVALAAVAVSRVRLPSSEAALV
jgi:predicted MFS family arabinose efflux permease